MSFSTGQIYSHEYDSARLCGLLAWNTNTYTWISKTKSNGFDRLIFFLCPVSYLFHAKHFFQGKTTFMFIIYWFKQFILASLNSQGYDYRELYLVSIFHILKKWKTPKMFDFIIYKTIYDHPVLLYLLKWPTL